MPTPSTPASGPAPTVLIADWIAASAKAELPSDVRHHALRLVVDHMAAVIPGAVDPMTKVVTAHASENYGGNAATALGGGRLSALGAALVNATAAHGLELDDGYTPGSVHPSVPLIPAVLAAAQKHNTDIETVLRAIAVGVEVVCRIAAAGHPATRRRGFHNTALAGVLGAAAGTAVVLGLDPATSASALGVAGSHAGGLFEFLGTSAQVKRFHPGKAARDGLASAELAAAGLSGPDTVLEGANGYFAGFAGKEGSDWSATTLTEGLGSRWTMLDTYVKPYPCCRHLHSAVDAALALRERTDDTSAINSIAVGTYGIATHHAHQTAGSVAEAQMSIPYAVAAALRFGPLSLIEFDDDHRADPEVRRLTNATTVHLDQAHEQAYPASRPATVTLTTHSGTTAETVFQPYGEPSNPMSDEALSQKFLAIVRPILGAEADTLLDELWALRNLDFLDRIDAALR